MPPVLTAWLLHSAWLHLLPSHRLSLKDGAEENFFKVVTINSCLIALCDLLFLPYQC